MTFTVYLETKQSIRATCFVAPGIVTFLAVALAICANMINGNQA